MDTISPPSLSETKVNVAPVSEGIWGRLSLPHPSIQEPERRRRVRLLSSLLVILLLAGVAANILTLWMEGPTIIIFIASISIILFAAAYALSRTERYPIAAALTLITIWVSVLSASIIFHDPEFLYFLFLGPLVSSQFLSPRATMLVSAASVITILLMHRVDPLHPVWHIVDSAFLVGLTGALATVSALAQRQDIQHIEQQSRDLSAHLIELMRGREALQQSEARLAHILENAAEAIITTDETQNIILFNKGAERIFGYRADEVLGQPLDLLIPSRYADAHRQQVTAFGAGDQKSRPMGLRQEVHGRRKDGSEFPAQVGISTHVESDHTIFTAILIDVTERKLAEEQIRKNATQTQALAEISQLIVEVGLDYHAIVDAVTRRVAELIGDACFVNLLSDDGQQLQLASIFHSQPEAVEVIREIIVTACFAGFEDLPGRVIKSGQPILIDEVSQEEIRAGIRPEYRLYLEQYGIHSILIVPLRAQDRVIGTLSISRDRPNCAYKDDDGTFLQEVADRTALAITNAQLFEKAQRNLRKVQGLREIDVAITGSVDLRIILETVLDQLLSQTGVDAANVLVLNPDTMTLNYTAGRGFRTRALQHTHLRVGEGYAGQAALKRRHVKIPDLRGRQTDMLRSPMFLAEAFVSYCAIPLIAKGQVKGVLEIFHRNVLNLDKEWMDFLEALAGQAAIAIDNNRLFDDLQRSNHELVWAYDATIEGWSRALDLRDKETEGHTQRVTEMSLRLAEAFGVSSAELVHIRRGALLHDIGKMGIPDRILLKPGPLNEDEWVLMRKHPQYAYEMLAPISYLRPALDIPYCHHEKWDGSGYPRGLKGEAIPLAARIFAIVDVWDALSSERPYRPAWPEEKICEYLSQEKGKHFDPEVVDAFFNLMAVREGN